MEPTLLGSRLSVRDNGVTIEHRSSLDGPLTKVWDDRVTHQPGADVSQLTGWSRLRSTAGFTSSYLLAFHGATLVGGAQLLRRRLPLLGEIAYLPYGPMVFTDAHHERVAAALCRSLRDLRSLGLRALFVQPPDGGHDLSERLLTLGFGPSEAGIAPRTSIHVDLSRPPEELLAALGRKLRRSVRRWPDQGVTVRIGDEADLPTLARLHTCTAERRGFPALSQDYLARLYRELAPCGAARIFVGEIDGVPAAAALTTGCGGVLKTRISGFDRATNTTELRVPAAVRWTAMQWAQREGYRWFDFGGLSEASTELLLSGQRVDPAQIPGPDQFKVSFGGDAYRFPPAVELIGSPVLRHAYRLAKRSPTGQRAVTAAKVVLRGGRG